MESGQPLLLAFHTPRFLEEYGRIGKKVDPNVPHDEKREIAILATPWIHNKKRR
jgi:hypothetical protein